MAKNVLLIVEGKSDEVDFLNVLFNKCNKTTNYVIYSYNTTIHILAQELYDNYNDFDSGNIDIKLILSSLEKDEEKKKIFYENYSDIYMIFDFDPHHDHPHFDTVKRMLIYFNDSTNQGKLFINYPMMQSYKHFSELPCDNFKDLVVTLDEIKNYKELVGKISNFTNLEKFNYVTYYSIAVHQLKKANQILNNTYELFDEDNYLQLNYGMIYEYQYNLFLTQELVSVLNTCIFILVDFAPTRFFTFIDKHRNELLI